MFDTLGVFIGRGSAVSFSDTLLIVIKLTLFIILVDENYYYY